MNREDLQREFELAPGMAGLLPTFDNPYKTDASRIAVAADIHLPAHDPKLVARFVESAIDIKAELIILAGDVMDMQYFSRFGIDDPSTTFRQELDIAGSMLRTMAKYAPVLWTVGNHEDRLFRGRPLDMELLARMAGLTDEMEAGILTVSDHPTIHASVGNWMITHPAAYGTTPLVVPSKLATRYQMNVIAGHEHHWGMTLDETGNFYAISTGGCTIHRESAISIAMLQRTGPGVGVGLLSLMVCLRYTKDKEMSLEQEPLEKFVDATIAAPLDENGNFQNLSDATYAAHELVSVFGAFLELPTAFMGVPVGALIPPEDLMVLQLMLAAIHAQTCTPERKAEAEAYAARHMENVVKEMLGIAPEETQAAPKVELNKQLQDFLASLEGPTTEGQQEEGR